VLKIHSQQQGYKQHTKLRLIII